MRRVGLIAVFALVLVSLAAGPGWAGLNSWTGGLPEGGPIRALLVDPNSPTTIYVGTIGSGVFKTIDGGATWTQSEPTGLVATRTVRALVTDTTGTTIYAGVEEDSAAASSGGVYMSVDGGDSWTDIGSGLPNKKVQALVFDGSALYAGAKDDSGVQGGVFKWNGSWATVTNNLGTQQNHKVQVLAIDPRQSPPVIYAGVQSLGVYKSLDGGTSWTQLSNQGFTNSCLDSPDILSLVVDTTIPATPVETLYAGARYGGTTGPVGHTGCGQTIGTHPALGAGFFRYANDTPSPRWDRRMNGMQLVLPVVSVNVWTIVMNGSTIYIGTDVGVFRSTTGSGDWDLVPGLSFLSGLSNPVRTLGVDPTGTVILYAGTNGRGVFKRVGPNNAAALGSQPWIAVNTGLTALRAKAAVVGSRAGQRVLFVGLDSGGVVTSVDGGATWQDTAESGRTIRGFAVDPTSPSTIYAATAKGVIKSTSGGDTWSLASSGLPEGIPETLDPPPPTTVRAIVIDPANPSVLYAAVGGVYKSVDAGATWTAFNSNLPSPVTSGDGTVSAFVINHGPGTLAPWGTLFAATDGNGVYKSTNGGAWTPVNGVIPALDQHITALSLDPLRPPVGSPTSPPPGTVYAGTSTGKVYMTQNSGLSWLPVEASPPTLSGRPITALVVRLANPTEVYAATDGAGVYSLNATTNGWAPLGGAGLSSLSVAALGSDPEGVASLPTLYATTLGRGVFDFEFDPGANPPSVFPDFSVPVVAATSPFVATGAALDDTGVSKVFWSTNRGHAGLATGTANWSASVILERGLNLVTITAVDLDSHEGSFTFQVLMGSTQEDFDGDGKADVLWRHSSGAVCIWLMNGSTLTSSGCPGGAGPEWSIQGVGDFDGDGKADVLWRDTSGNVCIWLINGTSLSSSGCPGSVGLDWSIQDVADFDGDGKADILWRNSSGFTCIWLMNGTSMTSSGCPGSAAPEWSIQGVGDFDGDGKADILWRNSSGFTCIWLINGTSLSSSGCPGAPSNDWTIQYAADFDGDRKADILWRNSSGFVCVWLINGTSLSSSGCPGAPSNDWTIQ